MAAKLVLIQSVLSSIPIDILAASNPPKGIVLAFVGIDTDGNFV